MTEYIPFPATPLNANATLDTSNGLQLPNLVAGYGMAVTTPLPEHTVFFIINNQPSPITVTIPEGNGISAGQGDLNMPVQPGVAFIGPFESARFQQADGSVHVYASTDVTISPLLIPRP